MQKKLWLFLVFGIILVICSYSVMAAFELTINNVTMSNPTTRGNYSGTLAVSCTSKMSHTSNVTFAFNNTAGGAIGINASNMLAIVTNTSLNQTEFTATVSLNITSLPPGANYNISCYADTKNGTNNYTSWASAGLIRIDSTAPNVTSFTVQGTTNYYNFSGAAGALVYLNATVNDNLDGNWNISSVTFNITDSDGNLVGVYNATNSSSVAHWYNCTLNSSDITNGVYNVTVFAKDISGSLNSSETVYSIIFDKSVWSALTITKSSSTKTSLNLTISVTDVGNSRAAKCTVNRAGATVTGTGGTQYLAESSLDCGSTYSYIVTCADYAGNSRAASAFSFETLSCSTGSVSSSGGAGGTATTTWANTQVLTDTQFEAGYTKELSTQERFKVTVGSLAHHVGVKSLTATKATIEIASDPVTVELDVGEEAKVNVNSDGFYDIYVKLNSIANNKADVTIKKINEAIPAGAGNVSTTGEVGGEETGTEEGGATTAGGFNWNLWIIVIVVLVILIALGVVVKKRK